MHTLIARSIASLGFAVLSATIALAQTPLPAPTGDVLLTVSGDIAVTNGDGIAQFDRAMLEAMDPVDVTTSTIWTEGTSTFTGVPLHVLTQALGIADGTLRATAINDYAVEVPVSDAVEGGPIVAFEMDGAPMSVRSKGPLWIIYPYDDNPDYQTEVIYSRSIWQLDRIVVEQ